MSSRINCGGCGAVLGETDWEALVLTQRIEAGEVSRLVRGWSPNECVEVRRCACGKPIAARRIVAASA